MAAANAVSSARAAAGWRSGTLQVGQSVPAGTISLIKAASAWGPMGAPTWSRRIRLGTRPMRLLQCPPGQSAAGVRETRRRPAPCGRRGGRSALRQTGRDARRSVPPSADRTRTVPPGTAVARSIRFPRRIVSWPADTSSLSDRCRNTTWPGPAATVMS